MVRAWLCFVRAQDGCYSREVYSEKVICLCQTLALLFYPTAELLQGQVVRFIPGWFEARCIGCTLCKRSASLETIHVLVLVPPLLALTQNASWKLNVCGVAHPELHIRFRVAAGLAVPSSSQPVRPACPQLDWHCHRANGQEPALARVTSLEGSPCPTRAHQPPGQVTDCAVFLPRPLLRFFILTSSYPAYRMSFWPLPLHSIVCKQAVRSSGTELWKQTCEHERVLFKIAPVSRKPALPVRPAAGSRQ